MISLTLLPSQGQGSKVGPSHPIAGASSPSTQRPVLERPAGGSLSFASRSRVSEETKERDPRDAKVKVKLAESTVLVPFHDRPLEVKELLTETSKNKQLFQSLQDLYPGSSKDWTRLQTILFDLDRDQLTDKDWLAQLYSLVFSRSPSIWCRLADCLGAHLLDWTNFQQNDSGLPAFETEQEEDKEEVESVKYDDVFSDTSSSIMTDHTHSRLSSSGLEFEALHEVPMTFRTAPTRVRKHSYRYDENTTHEDAIVAKHQSLHHRRGSSVISTGHDGDVDDFLSKRRDGFAGIRLSCPTFTNRDRNISAPMTMRNRTVQEKAAVNIRQRGATVSGHQYVHHRRLSSLFLTPSDRPAEVMKKEVQDTSKEKSKTRSPSPPLKLASPSSSFARTFSAPRTTSARDMREERTDKKTSSSSSSSSPPKSERTLGLLPDGRTRHPSAGDGESSKEAIALLAFKRELQLSDCIGDEDDNNDGPKDRNRARSNTSMNSLFSPPISEDSFATTISPVNSSPVVTTKDYNSSLHQQNQQQPSAAPPQREEQHQAKSSYLIFPVSTKSSIPRSQYLIDNLQDQHNNDLVEEIKQVIGQDRYEQMCSLISQNERSQLSDQVLLEKIAKNQFQLIDQEKEERHVVEEHLIDEGYEKRWETFAKLCNAWHVDSAVIREAKRRGGPAMRLF